MRGREWSDQFDHFTDPPATCANCGLELEGSRSVNAIDEYEGEDHPTLGRICDLCAENLAREADEDEDDEEGDDE
ncbi:hypothetical protein KAW64_17210 [bacterium]|nr:hypothetical protein [bacterium]